MIQDKNVQGHSVTQRFEFWRTATQIFSESPIIGAGAGDVLSKYDETYEKQNTRLAKRYRLKAHNQYLSILVAVGLIGLSVIIFATVFTGVTDEHQIGHAFEEALPFTALLVVFFGIVAVIHDQHLFAPVIEWVLDLEGKMQTSAFYLANGVLSMISDNVFVATVYIGEVEELFLAGELTRDQFDALAVAINTGTNIPSVATPNGQAAFLFLLTSALAPLIRLSYGRMVIMALPYTITMSVTGLLALWYLG